MTLDEVEQLGGEGTLEAASISPAAMLSHLPMWQIGDMDLRLVLHGRELPLKDDSSAAGAIVPSLMRICDSSGHLVAVGESDPQRRRIKPRVVLLTKD